MAADNLNPVPDIERMRVEYSTKGIDLDHLVANPMDQFSLWFQQSCSASVHEPNAMILATVDANGRPSTRTVLLKQFDDRGFTFFTNFESRKASQIAANPNVSLLFPWIALERQVIVEGVAEKIPAADAVKYFLKRPLESQLGAWASKQSAFVESRKALEMQFEAMKRKFSDGKIPMPEFWGGMRVVPREIEFWQGRANRLHDRFRYFRDEKGAWTIRRLSP